MSDENKPAESAQAKGVDPTAPTQPKAQSPYPDPLWGFAQKHRAALDEKHERQFTNFIEIFALGLESKEHSKAKWANQDANSGGWILTEAGEALSEADYLRGVDVAANWTWGSQAPKG